MARAPSGPAALLPEGLLIAHKGTEAGDGEDPSPPLPAAISHSHPQETSQELWLPLLGVGAL